MREWLIDLLLTLADRLQPKRKKSKGTRGGKPTHAFWTQTHPTEGPNALPTRIVERPKGDDVWIPDRRGQMLDDIRRDIGH